MIKNSKALKIDFFEQSKNVFFNASEFGFDVHDWQKHFCLIMSSSSLNIDFNWHSGQITLFALRSVPAKIDMLMFVLYCS